MKNEVDTYLTGLDKWQTELRTLREILLNCGLTEDFKWMHPSYSYQGKNIALIHEFKEYCAILFHKGALLKDPEEILIQQTENTQAARQIRFTNLKEIKKLESTIKEYILKAIQIEKAGLKVNMKSIADFGLPEELERKFKGDARFKEAFKKLTPGRQKAYLLFFSKPKQTATRTSRIEKNAEKIFNGKGLNDCVCGRSKRMPNCDGSHKNL